LKAYILVQEIKIGEAIKRFLYHTINMSSSICSFEKINLNLSDINKYDLAIANIYDFSNKKYITTGFQYMDLFANKIPVVLFYYDNHLKPGYSLEDLPEYCFYLPLQIKDFLKYIKNPNKLVEPIINSLKENFRSHCLTSNHH